jgi:hypothetical protein
MKKQTKIIPIQTKGGSASRPTAEDVVRLSRVAEYHGAKALVLAEWRRAKKLELFRLRWQAVARKTYSADRDLTALMGSSGHQRCLSWFRSGGVSGRLQPPW